MWKLAAATAQGQRRHYTKARTNLASPDSSVKGGGRGQGLGLFPRYPTSSSPLSSADVTTMAMAMASYGQLWRHRSGARDF